MSLRSRSSMPPVLQESVADSGWTQEIIGLSDGFRFVAPCAAALALIHCAPPHPRRLTLTVLDTRTAVRTAGPYVRTSRTRHYLMCAPTHFEVTYAINPWMDPTNPVDAKRAHLQWEVLRNTYLSLGHRVDLIEPMPGQPDMVFAANGGLVVGGRAYGAK